jgi:hypothetical protein
VENQIMSRNPESQISPRRAQAALRQAEALKLRLSGATYDDIAQQLGYGSAESAWKAVRAGLKRTLQEPADQVRQLELDRCDRLLGAIWEKAIAGDGEAIDEWHVDLQQVPNPEWYRREGPRLRRW